MSEAIISRNDERQKGCPVRGSRVEPSSRNPTFGESSNAARKAGVHVRIEIRDDGIVATTIDEATAKSNLNADDELENWRRKKRNANQT